MKRKEDEMNSALDQERARSTATDLEKQEWNNLRIDLENKLAEAQNLNQSMQQELQRVRDDHESETQRLRDEVATTSAAAAAASADADAAMAAAAAAQQNNTRSTNSGDNESELQRENEELRHSLAEQQQVTEEVRHQAEEFLQEMRMLSQQSGSTYERQAELESTIESLEHEVREWRNRYARTKTQLRNMRASSMGVGIEHDAAKFVRERGFTDDNGLVKDVHVTKFQIALDELLQRARNGDPQTVMDAMKSVVVSVRRITKDIDVAQPHPPSEDMDQEQKQMRSKVSATANNLITASKNFAAGAGISPVSLLDAAASHLSAAIVDLLLLVKIRSTPAEELDDEDEGTITPVESSGFFSPHGNDHVSATQGSLPPPPPFQGLGGVRASADSSAYSPVNSPGLPADPYSNNPPPTSQPNGHRMSYTAVPIALSINGHGPSQGPSHGDVRAAEDLKVSCPWTGCVEGG